ncbi:MAG: hypothetical protein HeimC2_17910 [Candidatus Heimdallarchaeota archaeon LC_2]|nr:MAG: hypothetical protein HeimC2_17910 [Candidatus Heimdallarchaeota archaeon LC_2]
MKSRISDSRDNLSSEFRNYPFGHSKIKNNLLSKFSRWLNEIRIFNLILIINNQTVGIVSIERSSDKIYGMWNTYVKYKFRGQGISKHLYLEGFDFLSRQKIQNAITTVAINNIPSLKTISANFDGSFDVCFYTGIINTNINVNEVSNQQFTLSNTKSKKSEIWEKYEKKILSQQWKDFFEISSIDTLTHDFRQIKINRFQKIKWSYKTFQVLNNNLTPIGIVIKKLERLSNSFIYDFFIFRDFKSINSMCLSDKSDEKVKLGSRINIYKICTDKCSIHFKLNENVLLHHKTFFKKI